MALDREQRLDTELNKLLDDPRALEFDAPLVNRLRRLRVSRARSRA